MSETSTGLRFRCTHLLQLNKGEASQLAREWATGLDEFWPAVDRHTDDIRLDDLVLIWVAGPGNDAGVVGFGIAGGVLEKRRHARSYQDADGPRTLRQSALVTMAWMAPHPVLTRTEMRRMEAFADFELFSMPNRPNVFAVNEAQAQVVLDRLAQVVGK